MSIPDKGYLIEVDHGRDMVRATLDGYWDPTVATDFAQDLLLAFAGERHTPLNLLVDARKQGVQSQEVVTALAARTNSFNLPIDRVAVLIGSSLHKMQARRIAPAEKYRLFSSETEALAWLCQS